MIHGIGCDIVAVARLQAMWARHGDKAREKVLAPAEYEAFDRATDKGRFLAKRFAAKEAFAKAFGTGVRPPVSLPSIAVVHDELGKPGFVFYGELQKNLEHRRVHLSISDEADYAIAYVILENA